MREIVYVREIERARERQRQRERNRERERELVGSWNTWVLGEREGGHSSNCTRPLSPPLRLPTPSLQPVCGVFSSSQILHLKNVNNDP